jgi:hypothetical protein
MATLVVLWGCQGGDKPTEQAPAPTETAVKPSYSKASTVFSFAWLADINSGMIGSRKQLEDHAVQSMQAVLQDTATLPLIGKWELVWGPAIQTWHRVLSDSSMTINTMALFKGKDPEAPDKTMYVVGIAGTNFISAFDWGFEDFNVYEMMAWPPKPENGKSNVKDFEYGKLIKDPKKTAEGPYISDGIRIGLNILFNQLKDKSGQTLLEHLKKHVGTSTEPTEIAVAGHSLGGGLSPCVALSLKDNQSYWNPAGNFTISTYPYAGQSPGNDKYAAYFHSQIPTDKFFGQYNSLDVVPHGFQADMMEMISGLYNNVNPALQNQCLIGGVVNCVVKRSEAFHYTSLYNASNAFTAQINFNDSTVTKAESTWNAMSNIKKGLFIAEAKKQGCKGPYGPAFVGAESFASIMLPMHIDAYVTQMNAEAFAAIMRKHIIKSQKLPDQLWQWLTLALRTKCIL